MNIAVIGCGWLGLPLAERLLELNHCVVGTTTRTEQLELLKGKGISPIHYDGNKFNLSKTDLSEIDVAVINFPPSKTQDYSVQISEIAQLLPDNCKVIFTSSTGVYIETNSILNEQASIKADHPVAKAENELKKIKGNLLTIIRLAGLIGNGRNPVKYFAGKKDLSDGSTPVNLIQLEDVVQAIVLIIDQNAFGQVYNLAFPDHPTRNKYYTKMAELLMLETPSFLTESSLSGKIIDGSRIVNELPFNYEKDLYI